MGEVEVAIPVEAGATYEITANIEYRVAPLRVADIHAAFERLSGTLAGLRDSFSFCAKHLGEWRTVMDVDRRRRSRMHAAYRRRRR
jgi:hypothetical protein